MEAIVLAGGLGTRLRAAVSSVPKPMAPVAGRPFLELLLKSLKRRGVSRVVLSIGYMSEAVTSYFDSNPMGIDLIYEVESNPLGTGGAIKSALGQVVGDAAFVFNGDTYLDLDLGKLSALWPGDRSPIVVARPLHDVGRFGVVHISNGRIERFAESSGGGAGYINAGCYLLPRETFSSETHLPSCFSFERDFLAQRPPLSLRAFIAQGHFIDIGVPADYARAQVELADLAQETSGRSKDG
jgi:D-glycero-alpha-D-manno-heptose 1-phosphate guanylyltransferase